MQRRICTFHLDPYLFGVDVEVVQEVVVDQPVTSVPLAPPAVRGVINLRGEIITAIDLASLLELPEREKDASRVSLVIRAEDELVSFMVDEAGEVIEIEEQDLEPPPNTLVGPARQLIVGAYKLPSRLLLVLDPLRAASTGSGEPQMQAETE